MGYSVVIRTRDRRKRMKLEIQTTKDFMCWDNWDLFCIHWEGVDFFKKKTDMIKFQFLKILLIAVEKNNKEKAAGKSSCFSSNPRV